MALVKSKRLSKSRSVIVPKDLAANAGMFAGGAVDLVETAEGILLRNHVPTCAVCGSVDNVKKILGREICASCVEKIRKEIEENYA